VITKVLTEKLKRLPEQFLQPVAAVNCKQSGQYAEYQHGQYADIQYTGCGIYGLEQKTR